MIELQDHQFQIIENELVWMLLASLVTFPPNNHPAPRGLTAQFSMSSGSDHIRSATIQSTYARLLVSKVTNRKMHPHAEFPVILIILLSGLGS